MHPFQDPPKKPLHFREGVTYQHLNIQFWKGLNWITDNNDGPFFENLYQNIKNNSFSRIYLILSNSDTLFYIFLSNFVKKYLNHPNHWAKLHFTNLKLLINIKYIFFLYWIVNLQFSKMKFVLGLWMDGIFGRLHVIQEATLFYPQIPYISLYSLIYSYLTFSILH